MATRRVLLITIEPPPIAAPAGFRLAPCGLATDLERWSPEAALAECCALRLRVRASVMRCVDAPVGPPYVSKLCARRRTPSPGSTASRMSWAWATPSGPPTGFRRHRPRARVGQLPPAPA